jgi:membrane protein implicated in regulation of membrane protease activity
VPSPRTLGLWFWRTLNAASLAQWLGSIGGGAVVTAPVAVLAVGAGLPSPWSYVLAAGVFLLVAAGIVTLLSRRAARRQEQSVSEPQQEQGRVAVDLTRSRVSGKRWKISDHDTAIRGEDSDIDLDDPEIR